MQKIIQILIVLVISVSSTYAYRAQDNRGFPYQSVNSPTNFNSGSGMRPQPNYYQTHHINSPPNTIYLNRPTPNTIFLNRPNPHVKQNINFTNQPVYHHKHNFNVPYVIYYTNSLYPYYPTTNSYTSYDNSYLYDVPSVAVSELNSSISNVQSVPYGRWVQTSEGVVPEGAIVYERMNQGDTYYCRAAYHNIIYTGLLIRGEGCYIQDGSATIRFTNYDVLVQS